MNLKDIYRCKFEYAGRRCPLPATVSNAMPYGRDIQAGDVFEYCWLHADREHWPTGVDAHTQLESIETGRRELMRDRKVDLKTKRMLAHRDRNPTWRRKDGEGKRAYGKRMAGITLKLMGRLQKSLESPESGDAVPPEGSAG